jgi:ribonuclease III
MAKRSHDSLVAETSVAFEKRKRHKHLDASEALAGILTKCEDLVKAIAALGSSQAAVSAEIKEKLQLEGVKSKTRRALQLLDAQLSPNGVNHQEGAPQETHNSNIVLADAGQQGPAVVLAGVEPQKVLSHAFLVPGMPHVTRYTSSDIDEKPPLLPVLDPALEKRSLTYPGGHERTEAGQDYERLEWLGDAYIHIISTLLIYQTFPTHPPGRMSQLRELLLRNSTLAQFTLQYELDKRASIPQEFKAGGREGGSQAKEKARQKVNGDLFEAYFAATIESDPQNGVTKACDWIKALWRPFIAHHIKSEEARARRDLEGQAEGKAYSLEDAKNNLHSAIGASGVKIRYEEMPSRRKRDKDNPKLKLYTIGVYLDGWGEHNKLLAQGSALSKVQAGLKAAQSVLDNKKLIGPYIRKKEALRSAAAAQAQSVPQDSSRPALSLHDSSST